jgi:hypothetical protein
MSMPPTKPTVPVSLAMRGHHAHQERAFLLVEDHRLHIGQIDDGVDQMVKWCRELRRHFASSAGAWAKPTAMTMGSWPASRHAPQRLFALASLVTSNSS